MSRTRALTAVIVLSVFFAATCTAWASSAVGTWRSSSGNVFTIPYSTTDFDIVIKTAQGGKYLAHGRWMPGQVGTQFRYQWDNYPDKWGVATFTRSNPNVLRVQGSDGQTNYWIRQ